LLLKGQVGKRGNRIRNFGDLVPLAASFGVKPEAEEITIRG